MTITIESTDRIITLQAEGGGSLPARIWQGATSTGIPVHCFITRIAVDKTENTDQFARELQECRVPSPEIDRTYPMGIPLRLVL